MVHLVVSKAHLVVRCLLCSLDCAWHGRGHSDELQGVTAAVVTLRMFDELGTHKLVRKAAAQAKLEANMDWVSAIELRASDLVKFGDSACERTQRSPTSHARTFLMPILVSTRSPVWDLEKALTLNLSPKPQ